jgi:hypothetical protein
MGYYWLNQRREQRSGYSDVEGEVYHYRSTVAGSKQFSEGDWFVYYRPGEHVLFGAGRVAEIEVVGETEEQVDSIAAEIQPNVPSSRNITDYLAHMTDYRSFDPPVSARKIKEEISFLRGRQGLSGVPQNSIYAIDRDDYVAILERAEEEDLLTE